jgi:hypothetical protein
VDLVDPAVRGPSTPTTWFLTLRAVEVAVLVLLAGAVQELWITWRASVQYSADGTAAAAPTFMDRITGMALYGGYRGPIALVLGAVLLGGCLVVLHRAGPVANARILRWEWLVLFGLLALMALLITLVGVLALFGDDPFRSDDPSVVSGYQGPGLVAQVLANLAWPVATLALLAPSGLWWLRLPDEADEVDEADTADEGLDLDGRTRVTQRSGGRDEEAARPDQDAIVLDGVEHIPAVERLEPRPSLRGDGSTSSGYDDYFRRS